MTPDEFPPPICVMNGSYYPCKGELTYGPNPFNAEIYNDHIPEWLCDLHYELCADEI